MNFEKENHFFLPHSFVSHETVSYAIVGLPGGYPKNPASCSDLRNFSEMFKNYLKEDLFYLFKKCSKRSPCTLSINFFLRSFESKKVFENDLIVQIIVYFTNEIIGKQAVIGFSCETKISNTFTFARKLYSIFIARSNRCSSLLNIKLCVKTSDPNLKIVIDEFKKDEPVFIQQNLFSDSYFFGTFATNSHGKLIPVSQRKPEDHINDCNDKRSNETDDKSTDEILLQSSGDCSTSGDKIDDGTQD